MLLSEATYRMENRGQSPLDTQVPNSWSYCGSLTLQDAVKDLSHEAIGCQ